MRVVGVWRYPVKSMQGESLDAADVAVAGVAGDRVWGVRDEVTGKILTGRRDPKILFAHARLVDDGPVIELDDGQVLEGETRETDKALSVWLGKDVRLVRAADEPPRNAEFYDDATDETSAIHEYTMAGERFTDAMPLLLLTTAALRAGARLHPDGQWDPRRFRANVIVDADGDDWVEDGWQRQQVMIGGTTVVPRQPCPRCTMVTRAQPGGLDGDLDIFRTLARHHGTNLGMWTTVATPGRVAVGDPVLLLP